MIRRYDYGTPYRTEAVVADIPVSEGYIPYFVADKTDAGLVFTYKMDLDEMIFGLGESVRGVNKRGHLYRGWNSDEPNHREDTNALYGAHNFMIFSSEKGAFGVYFDDPGEMLLDLGYTQHDTATITSVNGDLSVYIIEEAGLREIVRAFRQIIGRSYLPPKWGFGYIQSRWGYTCEEDMRRIVREHRKRHIPLDGVSMDIDYMDHFKDFTWHDERFPDVKALVKELGKDHARLVPIIDAGIKEEKGYDVDEDGLEKGYFVKKEDGDVFVGAVWPGRCHFPDFLRDEVRQWFGDYYHRLLEAGIEGFWNDMNEPALFYSAEGLKAAMDEIRSMNAENMDMWQVFHLRDVVNGISNSREDYRRFYHLLDGKPVRHDKVHNLYGANMTRAAAQGFRSFNETKRFLLFSRSSYIGAHRYGGIWQGDNHSWWSHILMNLKMLPSLNMCGFLFTGADLGGFGCHTTEDLLLRWLQLGVFTPIMRNHSALGTREQEIFQFSMQEDMKNILTVRYALLPYIYSEFMKAALTGDMMFRPLAFDYPGDQRALRVEDQMMLGNECMIAPVYEQNARGRYVYLPEDMLLVRFRSADDYDIKPMQAGNHWVDLALNEMALFIRKGCMIPKARGAEWVEAVDASNMTMLGWINDDASYTFYDDDGVTTDPVLENGLHTFTAWRGEDGFLRLEGEGYRLVSDLVTK